MVHARHAIMPIVLPSAPADGFHTSLLHCEDHTKEKRSLPVIYQVAFKYTEIYRCKISRGLKDAPALSLSCNEDF